MDRNLITGCLLLVSLAALAQAQVPYRNHVYLGYTSPFDFVKAFSHNARPFLYHTLRNRRSSPMPPHHSSMPAHHGYNPMPYSHNYGYNSMLYHPFSIFDPMMNFPRFSMPYMPAFPYYSPSRPMYNDKPHNDNTFYPSDPFGSHFMKMMGFDFNKGPTFPKVPVTNGNSYNGGFNYGNTKQTSNGDGKSYEMSYSKSYNMNSANGKGHMVMKDSSYVNNNGQVEMHNDPARHYTMNADGTFVPDNSYN